MERSNIMKVDKSGSLRLSAELLRNIGVDKNDKIRIFSAKDSLVIKPLKKSNGVVDEISSLNLPAAEWDKMEDEIIKGAVS